MFISTEDNHAVHISLEKGKIIGCRFRFKRGLDALPLIMEMEAGFYSFNPGAPGPSDTALPPTDALLQMLTNTGLDTPAEMPVQGDIELTEITNIIVTELARYLGPIASLIVEDYLDDIGPIHDSGSLQKIVNSAASEIADERKRDEFVKNVFSKL